MSASTKHVGKVWGKLREDIRAIADREAWAYVAGDKLKGETQAYRYYIDDVRSAMQVDQGIIPTDDDDPDPCRMRIIKVTRPWGQCGKIIKAVAKETGLSEGKVRECWREFCRLENRLRADAV